jgi:hypothetical protein
MPRLQRLMYALLYPAVLGTVFVGLLPALVALLRGQSIAGSEMGTEIGIAKTTLTLGIVLHFVVDYLFAQEVPQYGWRGFVLDLGILLALWAAAGSVHLGSLPAPDVRYVCIALAATYACFLLWLLGMWASLQHRVLLVLFEMGAFAWFTAGALWLTNWKFAATGLFMCGLLLPWMAKKALATQPKRPASMNVEDEVTDAERATFNGEHEDRSGRRVVAFQKALDSVPQSSESAFDALRNRLELQLRIEELIVKSRESEHVKWKVYGPLWLSGAATVISVASAVLSVIGYHQRP